MLDFWPTLDVSSPSEAWRSFPPPLRGIIIVAIALLFANFFIRDYNRGGKRYIVYGPVALLLLIYAAAQFGFF